MTHLLQSQDPANLVHVTGPVRTSSTWTHGKRCVRRTTVVVVPNDKLPLQPSPIYQKPNKPWREFPTTPKPHQPFAWSNLEENMIPNIK